MEARKLTEDEVDRLFGFCAKHYVPEYDLQIELVDHLASGIEEQWSENPELPFPVALNRTFDKFGVFGFSKIKSQKEKELSRKYRKLFWKHTLEFYKLPKVILTFLLTFILYSLYITIHNFFWVTVTIFALVMLFDLLYAFWIYPKKYKIKTKEGKSFLVVNYLKGRQVGLNFIFQVPLQSIQILDHFNYSYLNNKLVMFSASLALVTLGVLLYVYFIVLPQKMKEHFTEQFPQFILA